MKIPKLKPFKIRCSAIGQIMTNARSGGGMGETAKTYCKTWLIEQIYSVRKEFTSKYTEKGKEVEDDAIFLAQEHLQWGLFAQNTRYFENEYMTGTPDIITTGKYVLDIKCPWDCHTFPLIENKCPEKDYDWQLTGYTGLCGKEKAAVVYCLMDMPEKQLTNECFYRYGNEFTKEQYDALKERYTFSHLPYELRVKFFEVDVNDAALKSVYERVMECREYIELLKQQYNIIEI